MTFHLLVLVAFVSCEFVEFSDEAIIDAAFQVYPKTIEVDSNGINTLIVTPGFWGYWGEKIQVMVSTEHLWVASGFFCYHRSNATWDHERCVYTAKNIPVRTARPPMKVGNQLYIFIAYYNETLNLFIPIPAYREIEIIANKEKDPDPEPEFKIDFPPVNIGDKNDVKGIMLTKTAIATWTGPITVVISLNKPVTSPGPNDITIENIAADSETGKFSLPSINLSGLGVVAEGSLVNIYVSSSNTKTALLPVPDQLIIISDPPPPPEFSMQPIVLLETELSKKGQLSIAAPEGATGWDGPIAVIITLTERKANEEKNIVVKNVAKETNGVFVVTHDALNTLGTIAVNSRIYVYVSPTNDEKAPLTNPATLLVLPNTDVLFTISPTTITPNDLIDLRNLKISPKEGQSWPGDISIAIVPSNADVDNIKPIRILNVKADKAGHYKCNPGDLKSLGTNLGHGSLLRVSVSITNDNNYLRGTAELKVSNAAGAAGAPTVLAMTAALCLLFISLL